MASATDSGNVSQLVDHLFRHETGKLVAVLTRIFGVHNLQLAEDVVQDTLLEAMNVWSYNGVPEQPVPWLYKVARNKALNIVKREKYSRQYIAAAAYSLKSSSPDETLDHLFSEAEINDDQLRMMFTCCHPSISVDSQIALTLKTLCGFSMPEIAKAFLTTEETINKRLVRARQKIREDCIVLEVPPSSKLEERLDAVLQTIYLLFNEGYHASTGHDVIRYEVCAEAIRLAEIVAASEVIKDKSNVFACLALMYLNASRFSARQNEKGEIVTMAEQDRSQWDRQLIQKGFIYLERSAMGNKISVYHLMAMISAYHCSASDFSTTDWQSILLVYNELAAIDPSPLVLLNRAIVVAKVTGASDAIDELEKLKAGPSLKKYHLFYSTLGELYMQAGRFREARTSFETAIRLTNVPAEQRLLRKKLEGCAPGT